MMQYVYVNGAFLPSADAHLNVQDRGFRFGDGLFETIAIHNNTPYQWEFHLNRLEQGLSALYINAREAWHERALQLIERNEINTGFLRITVSRGVGSQGYLPSTDATPTILMETLPPRAETVAPATLHLSSYRKISRDALPGGMKLNATGTNSSLALLQAKQEGADEALQLSANGHLSEASSGNLFWLKDGTLHTPSLNCDCLNGSTRAAILRITTLPVHECESEPSALHEADAVFITNCAWGIRPVSRLNPQGWDWSTDHPIITQLQSAYQADIEAYCA